MGYRYLNLSYPILQEDISNDPQARMKYTSFYKGCLTLWLGEV